MLQNNNLSRDRGGSVCPPSSDLKTLSLGFGPRPPYKNIICNLTWLGVHTDQPQHNFPNLEEGGSLLPKWCFLKTLVPRSLCFSSLLHPLGFVLFHTYPPGGLSRSPTCPLGGVSGQPVPTLFSVGNYFAQFGLHFWGPANYSTNYLDIFVGSKILFPPLFREYLFS